MSTRNRAGLLAIAAMAVVAAGVWWSRTPPPVPGGAADSTTPAAGGMTPPAAVPAGVRFTGNSIGEGIRGEERPQIAHVAVADLDRDGLPDVIVCDATRNQVTWIRQAPRGTYAETLVANEPAPAHVEVIDVDGDKDLDVVVGSLFRPDSAGRLRRSDRGAAAGGGPRSADC